MASALDALLETAQATAHVVCVALWSGAAAPVGGAALPGSSCSPRRRRGNPAEVNVAGADWDTACTVRQPSSEPKFHSAVASRAASSRRGVGVSSGSSAGFGCRAGPPGRQRRGWLVLEGGVSALLGQLLLVRPLARLLARLLLTGLLLTGLLLPRLLLTRLLLSGLLLARLLLARLLLSGPTRVLSGLREGRRLPVGPRRLLLERTAGPRLRRRRRLPAELPRQGELPGAGLPVRLGPTRLVRPRRPGLPIAGLLVGRGRPERLLPAGLISPRPGRIAGLPIGRLKGRPLRRRRPGTGIGPRFRPTGLRELRPVGRQELGSIRLRELGPTGLRELGSIRLRELRSTGLRKLRLVGLLLLGLLTRLRPAELVEPRRLARLRPTGMPRRGRLARLLGIGLPARLPLARLLPARLLLARLLTRLSQAVHLVRLRQAVRLLAWLRQAVLLTRLRLSVRLLAWLRETVLPTRLRQAVRLLLTVRLLS